MMPTRLLVIALLISWLAPVLLAGTLPVRMERVRPDDAEPGFKLREVPPPSKNDAATGASFELILGGIDPNGGGLDRLHDGKLPADQDEPPSNCFLGVETESGRLLVDLGQPIEVLQVNTYSWHPGSRGPQVFKLYGSAGTADGFVTRPGRDVALLETGWELLAEVDTRPKTGEPGGQYGVSIGFDEGARGAFRYLLFDLQKTRATDRFAHTFLSEIDVVDRQGPAPEPVDRPVPTTAATELIPFDDGRYELALDLAGTPDLADWVHAEIVPLVRDWYPKIVRMLPSEGFEAPRKVRLIFDPRMRGVAATSGTRVRCAAGWFRANLKGEARGAVFHELIHVVQQYGRVQPGPGFSSPPGWLVEGIADYLRWFHFEPASRGAEITQSNLANARYDASYRITANFLHWASQRHGADLVLKLNGAIREGRYGQAVWKDLTGQTVQDLGAAWRAEHEKRLGEAPAN